MPLNNQIVFFVNGLTVLSDGQILGEMGHHKESHLFRNSELGEDNVNVRRRSGREGVQLSRRIWKGRSLLGDGNFLENFSATVNQNEIRNPRP
jgi:hypothetical protein